MTPFTKQGVTYFGNSADKIRSQSIKNISSEYGLDDKQQNLLSTAGLTNQRAVEQYVNNLLSQQYSVEDERRYNEGLRDEQRKYDEQQIQRMRQAGLNPDLLGVGEGSSPISGNGSIYPSSGVRLDSAGGSLSQTFAKVSGVILQLASFGLQAYSTVSGSLMKSALFATGLAETDLKNVPFNGMTGEVENVDDIIARGIAARGLRGRAARAYAAEVSARINTMDEVAKRLHSSNALKDEQFQSRLRTDEYYNNTLKLLRDKQETEMKMAAYDLEIARQKEEFIKNHPEYTADSLETALAQSQANLKGTQLDNAGKALANENQATQNAIAQENLTQEQAETDVKTSNAEVAKLKNEIERIRIEGLDEMIEFCRKYENEKELLIAKTPGGKYSPEYRAWAQANEKRTQQYTVYRKHLRNQGFYRNPRGKFKASVGTNGISAGVGN